MKQIIARYLLIAIAAVFVGCVLVGINLAARVALVGVTP